MYPHRYICFYPINGSSTSIAPDVGKLSGSDFHPLNSVIPTPAVELELELVELLDDALMNLMSLPIQSLNSMNLMKIYSMNLMNSDDRT
jgi:hypothetical protein